MCLLRSYPRGIRAPTRNCLCPPFHSTAHIYLPCSRLHARRATPPPSPLSSLLSPVCFLLCKLLCPSFPWFFFSMGTGVPLVDPKAHEETKVDSTKYTSNSSNDLVNCLDPIIRRISAQIFTCTTFSAVFHRAVRGSKMSENSSSRNMVLVATAVAAGECQLLPLWKKSCAGCHQKVSFAAGPCATSRRKLVAVVA